MRLFCRTTAVLSLTAILWAAASASQAARVTRGVRTVPPVAPVGGVYAAPNVLVVRPLPARAAVVAGVTWVAPAGTWITGTAWPGVRRVTRRGVITAVPNRPARWRVLHVR